MRKAAKAAKQAGRLADQAGQAMRRGALARCMSRFTQATTHAAAVAAPASQNCCRSAHERGAMVTVVRRSIHPSSPSPLLLLL